VRRYRLTGPARADLRNVWNAIAHRSAARADRFLDELALRFQEIADRPRPRGSTDIMFDSGCHLHPICEFIIFYRPQGHGIEIIRILEGPEDHRYW
jgi:plasmid stabilization system protein ParE